MIPIISSLIPLLGSVLDKVIPNKAEAERVKLELQAKLLEQEGKLIESLIKTDVIQAEINKTDAQSTDKFKSYWRPSLAWVCVLGFTWHTVIQPLIMFGTTLYTGVPPVLPAFDGGMLNTVLFGILGLAGYRTYEKKSHLTK